MSVAENFTERRFTVSRRGAVAIGLAIALSTMAVVAWPQQEPAAGDGRAMIPAAAPQTRFGEWDGLSKVQRATLRPLMQLWASMDEARREKWLLIANRAGQLPVDARARLQARMEHWARLTPQERAKARMGYLRAKSRDAKAREVAALEPASTGLLRVTPGATTILAKVPATRASKAPIGK